ncbi:beta-galactosidase [Flammeovirga yaeyamensis]|uniref:Beta-galactosidase n=1 Tax=Flammeovirga yaeyamensis TaxID=367791 RepID=A0AAX1NCH3_9BACT|nr:beta-galactosidase [Flammeovirga yaeyamensis]MBB3696897.1 hypothetical protein [Flammeovirga yaeyamensis]NMF33561.1 family 14 glycosylhydrolase [Flammeovirga yaeyamensis]QWG05170.1 beta-galactosidase [Flammeovirga yaeyamensis]
MKKTLLNIFFSLLAFTVIGQSKSVSVGHIDQKPVVMVDDAPVLFAGIQYWGLDHWNDGHWEEDIKNIKSLGLNGIRLNIAWDHIEENEGIFTFNQLDKLIDMIEKEDLYVILQFNQSAHEWKPKWFENKYNSKELLAKDIKGKPQYSRLSFASKPFKQHYYNYVRNTIAHVKGRKSIVAYSVYTEPHFADKEQWMDYNKYNREAFRDWVHKRYKTIENVNQAWGTTYANFHKVEPFRKNIPSNWEKMPTTDRKQFADWNLWNCIAKSDFIGGLIQECKKIDKETLYIQNMMWKWTSKYGANVALDPEINYSYADVIGINVYPLGKNAFKIEGAVNFIRTLFNNEKPVWLGEFSTKSGNPSTDQLNKMLEGCFDAGGTGFVYFTYNGQAEKGNEEYGIEHYGILDRHRQKKDAYYELKSYLSKYIKGKHSDILNQKIEKADVQFLWPQMNKIYGYLSENYNYNTYISAFIYATLENGWSIDVVSEFEVIQDDIDFNLPLLTISMPFTNKKVGNALRRQIRNKGLNVFINGRYSENIYSISGLVNHKGYPRLDNTTGVSFSSLEYGSDDKIQFSTGSSFSVLSDFPAQGTKVKILPSDNFKVLGKWQDGSPALIEKNIGSGKMIYMGTHFFHPDFNSDTQLKGKILELILHQLNDSTSDQSSNSRKGKSKKKRLINLNDKLYQIPLEGDGVYQVFTIEGKNVSKGSFSTHEYQINLNHIRSGKYLIKVQTSSDRQTDIIVLH